MNKRDRQLVIAVVALAASIAGQIYNIDVIASLSIAAALAAYLSGYNTYNENLPERNEE